MTTTTLVISQLIEFIKSTIGDKIDLMDQPIYDPNLDFRDSVLGRRRIYHDSDFMAKTVVNDDRFKIKSWSCLTWNRSELSLSSVQQRKLKFYDDRIGNYRTEQYKFKLVACNFISVIYCNSLSKADRIEELFLLGFSDEIAFDVKLDNDFTIPVRVNEYTSDGTGVLNLEDTGNIAKFGFDVRIEFPIFDDPDVLNLIREVNLDIYDQGVL